MKLRSDDVLGLRLLTFELVWELEFELELEFKFEHEFEWSRGKVIVLEDKGWEEEFNFEVTILFTS